MMKTFAVSTSSITVYVRTGNAVQTFAFRTKRQADKKLLQLLKDGYTLDRTHETIREIVSF